MLDKITAKQTVWAAFSLVVIIGALILNHRASSPFEQIKTVEYTFRSDRLHPDMVHLIKKGQKIVNSPGGQNIGKIHSFEIRPHLDTVITRNGDIKKANDPFYKNAFIKVRAKGYANEDLVALHNEVIQAGASYKLNTALYVLDGKILSIDILDE